MNKDNIVWIIGGAIIAGIIGWWGLTQYQMPGNYDALAQCLTEKGVKLYGAYWCPHCQEQKRDFGKSFKYLDYIECSLPNNAGQTSVCKEAGIESYPTWQMTDGSRVTGKVELDKLAELNGCVEALQDDGTAG